MYSSIPTGEENMEQAQMKEVTLEVLKSAEDIYDKDAVFAKLFTAGIPFTKIQVLYREVGLAEGLIVDTAKAKEDVFAFLGNQDILSFEDYAAVIALEALILEEVGSMPADLVMKCIRSFYKEQEVVLPRATREYSPRGPRGSKVAEAIADYAVSTVPENLTRQGMYDVVRPHLKAPKNAYDQVNAMFLVIFAVHNNLTYEAAVETTKDIPLLSLSDLEANDVGPETAE
jgi:hypothetical protein